MNAPLVELLYFDGCPNWQATRELIMETFRRLEIEPTLELLEVGDQEAAQRLRFPGSPTVRVDGDDIDPFPVDRGQYTLSCRIYRSEHGMSGQPDPSWLEEALRRAGRRSRLRQLTQPEQRAYQTVLKHFTAGSPPAAGDVEAAAADVGLEAAHLRETLTRLDFVHFDTDGAPLVAYPFSANPRGHRVVIDSRTTVEAMCAIDALGIAAMLDLPIEISSHDPRTRTPVSVHVEPSGDPTWQPPAAVVLSARNCSDCADGPSYQSTRTLVNFFENTTSARASLDADPGISGRPVSILEAAARGRAIFGDLLAPPSA